MRTASCRRLTLSLCSLLLTVACTGEAPSRPPPRAPEAAGIAPPAAEAKTSVEFEADRLRSALVSEVPQHTSCGPIHRTWIEAAQVALASAKMTVDHAQLLVVVDRNPAVEELCLVLAFPSATWQVIGGSKVSTGQAGRRGYFITPTGVFPHTEAVVDYRAEGTFNENGIRGLGIKGMRVWDFGWQRAQKGWRTDHELGEMRLLLHATDPDYLEPRLGRPGSQGCVRIPATMNRFLDHHGVLDASYERAARTDERIVAVLAADRQPTPLAGDTLVIIDSAVSSEELQRRQVSRAGVDVTAPIHPRSSCS